MGKLLGKVAVVTGGSSGLGLAAAKRFVDQGAQVVIAGPRDKEIMEAAAEVGWNVSGICVDVSRLDELDRLYDFVQNKYGRIDLLVANADISDLLETDSVTEEHFNQLFTHSVKSLYFMVKKALPLFREGGVIILTASSTRNMGVEAMAVYNAANAAASSFVRALSIHLKARKIRLSSMQRVAMAMSAAISDGQAQEEYLQGLEKLIVTQVTRSS